MKKEKTIMKVECAWCGADLGTKDGHGSTGTTHGICPECAAKEWAKLGGRPPRRWNLVARFLEWNRRRTSDRRTADQRAALQAKAEKEADDRRALEDMFATNPGLHARIMLTGRRLVHYLEPEDLAQLNARVANEPEVRCRWN